MRPHGRFAVACIVTAPGETDLAAMLAVLDARRRPGVYTMVETTSLDADLVGAAHALVRESSSIAIVLAVDDAVAAGFEISTRFAWLTLAVASSLDAVGLTAVVADRLAARAIPCNVLAGYRHDHLLVPDDRADEASRVLRSLRAEGS